MAKKKKDPIHMSDVKLARMKAGQNWGRENSDASVAIKAMDTAATTEAALLEMVNEADSDIAELNEVTP